ncbi:hypothetical protein Scep_024129 [Stephania cephalantha]|uniref:Uncharacterized protein n=1 Tax=Stephania cephalantha TaxID=152367 RepID=A0AAP0EWM1_9MAGN
MNEDPRPYPPKAILAHAIPPSYSVGLGSSEPTSWAPPRRAGLLRDLQAKNTPSVSSHQYMQGQHPRNIYWNTNEHFNLMIHCH